MLRTTKNMKDKYEKIQSYLFTLIPEKWEEIYLYASVAKDNNSKKTGELFFYYLPKGILKKKIINVYEVPRRFNINEEQYLKIVDELYNCIKELRQDFVDTEQEIWTSVTITIANFKFKVEYSYDELPTNEYDSAVKHIIWRYNYLKLGGENKEERKILEEYFSNPMEIKKETYETGLYIKTENNGITFDKEENKVPKEVVVYEKEDISENQEEVEEDIILDGIEEEKDNITDKNDDDPQNFKNQILNL